MSNPDFDFEKLIQPIDANTFLTTYWEQKPFVLIREETDYYTSLFSRKDIDNIICFSNLIPSDIEIDSLNNSKDFKLSDSSPFPNINYLYKAYSQGNTLLIHELQKHCKPIATFCRHLEEFLNHTVNANLYLTPENSQAYSTHFDLNDVFILQLEGSKVWRIYDSFLDLPIAAHVQSIPKEILDASPREVYLKAGDLLYLPRGCVHEVLTHESYSLHLTIGIDVFKWSHLITEAIASVTEQNVNFRKALPVGFLHRSEAQASIKDQLAQLLQVLADSANHEDALEGLANRFIKPPLKIGEKLFKDS
ncbi:MAG: cupin domain-containing protein [Nostoc sp.]|uniref:cupin domain-containing protein n=1 Tax=Nostoc sp. TaxID=1180 RepID=UPI002FFC708A